MLSHVIVALIAFAWSIRYQGTFGVRLIEARRYWLKSINLALCYRGFANDSGVRSLAGAGKAAFFCCVYDVITDWRAYDPALFERFKSLSGELLRDEEAELALRLYSEEKNGVLECDGLSRGVTALEFITKVMGNELSVRQMMDFKYFGMVLQIVDDVLDIDEDRRDKSTNCLLSLGREKYLEMLARFSLDEARRKFPKGKVLWKVVAIAQKRAREMSGVNSLPSCLEPVEHIKGHPNHNITQRDGDKVFSKIGSKSKVVYHHPPQDAPEQTVHK